MNTIPLDLNELKKICLTPIAKFITRGSNYYFKDNGSNILAVAHLDYVCTGKPDFVSYKYKHKQYIMSETLDDRLGAYVILNILPALGINVDVLLTDDEELGQSTAQDFTTTKEYNWMFSFDRRGNSIVAYDYEDADLIDKVKQACGIGLAWGSFSDICYLEHLGVKGINFGVGYIDEHTPTCHAPLTDIIRGVNNFIRFYDMFKNTKLEHKSWGGSTYTGRSYYGSGGWDGYDSYCDYCGRAVDTSYVRMMDAMMCDDCKKCLNLAVKDVRKSKKNKDIIEGQVTLLSDAEYDAEVDKYDLCFVESDDGTRCNVCGMPHNQCQLWDTDLQYREDTMPVTVCDYCRDFIEEHVSEPDFLDNLEIRYY